MLTCILQKRWEERKSSYTQETKINTDDVKTRDTQDATTNPMIKLSEIVHQYSDDKVKRWKEEIDTLLVFVSIPSCYAPVTNTTTALSHMLTPRLGSTGWSVFCGADGIQY